MMKKKTKSNKYVCIVNIFINRNKIDLICLAIKKTEKPILSDSYFLYLKL